MRKPRVSIKQVAKHAGVSIATVSHVLNNKGNISDATRKQVRDAAQDLGFIPNRNASRLRSGQSLLIGLVVNDISNPFFSELAADVEAVAADAGYLSVMANSRDSLERQKTVIETMIGQGVAGFIISAASGSDETTFEVLKEHGVPFVLCVRDIATYAADFVGFDNFQAGVLVGRHLLERGYRDICFIGGDQRNINRTDRLNGLLHALGQQESGICIHLDMPGPATQKGGFEATLSSLKRAPRTDALVCFNDYVAIGAYEALYKLGKRTGVDVAVIGFDNVPESAAWNPPLTTVELFPRTIGRRAVIALLARITDNGSAFERVQLPPSLVVRGST
ncbi:LacI family DNA-binding transcriptional regulator [Tropicimonas sp. IMCC6043]|uniref:LacI family DNA-binding transcriptional regulator n=1 Tax=Tropicimonas sp. IMCC6043 TaxID=2510645 RepID=UPI00101D9518|nr:LacI family DNA-binding transcriptional regulator [Tropicimonas sp. IMCC6043]RYH06668.1 LacI family transcriptional regulator [Tropicimonas sp. IMCC6043]